jgi:hypothetical protein
MTESSRAMNGAVAAILGSDDLAETSQVGARVNGWPNARPGLSALPDLEGVGATSLS